ncbi:MAG: S8 family peptidase [Firmicutes bacterium]|nr:S8 family peptidase [Bacillota bacterium]
MYVPDQLLVKFRPGAQAQSVQALHQAAGGRVVRVIQQLGVHVLKLNPGISAASALATYRSSPLVQYAEQDVYAYALATPNDPGYPLQWHYPKIGLPAAWDVTTGAPVIVAVVDTGIRFDHPDLAGVTVPGYDFFDNDPDPTDPVCPSVDPNEASHGTHVAGTVAAVTNNNMGVAGVAWGGASAVKIMPIRVLGEDAAAGKCATGTAAGTASAIVYAADNGAKVINLSLGSYAASQTEQAAVNYALSRGVALVAAAGNDNTSAPSYPAAYPGVIAVSATACNDTKASYSNYGSYIWIAAPGGDIPDCDGDGYQDWVLSTWWSPSAGNQYGYLRGTSMAAPHVSGVAALLISRGFVGPDTIRNRLRDTAVDLWAPGWDQYFGWGLVNAALAVGASNPNGMMRAFAGTISGSTITRQSDVATVAATGSFTITNAQSGTRSVFAWQDFNGNGQVDLGDYYGRVDNVVINPGGTTSGVVVTVRRYTGTGLVVARGPTPLHTAQLSPWLLLALTAAALHGMRRRRGLG